MPPEVMKFAERARQGIRAWWRKSDNDGYTLINPYANATEAYRQIGEYYPQLVDIPPLKINPDKYVLGFGVNKLTVMLPNGQVLSYWNNHSDQDVPDELLGEKHLYLGGDVVPVNMRAIVRPPVPEDNQWCSFGVVSPQYTMLTPADAVEQYDRYVRCPVETIGALQCGKVFFITTQLPEISVRGDQINRYMLITSPLDGVSAAEVMLTDVRVVCMNTYRAALNSAKERFVVQHHAQVKKHFGAWMSFLYDMVTEKATILQEVYDILANKQVTSADINWIAKTVYNTPPEPDVADYPKEIYDIQYRNWERIHENLKEHRETFKQLFDGGAIGANTEAFNGTAYGAFQSIVQMENQAGQLRGIDGRMNQIFFGSRNKYMQKAFAAAVEVAKR